MSDQIKVTFGEIEAAAGNIGSAAQALDTLLDDLKGYLQPLYERYTGGAKEAWAAAQQQWDTGAAELNQTLAQIGTAVQTAVQNYQATENANMNRWG